MKVFISGGCKNGKSYYAQKLARDMAKEKSLPLYYVATMIPQDGEDEKRIARHLKERDGWGFTTIEQGRNIEEAYRGQGVYMIDSVTALVQNEMFTRIDDGHGGVDFRFNPDAGEKVAKGLKAFAQKAENAVFVSDYIFGDARHFDEMTESYIKGLATCDRTLADLCHKVAEVSFSNVIEYK